MKYRLKENVGVRCGVSVFTMPQGSIVDVKRFDEITNKVLIHWGGRDIDWHSSNILGYMEKIDES